MQNISSKLQAAITSVMIPFSSPNPFCLKSNSAGRITAELTGLKIHLWGEGTMFFFTYLKYNDKPRIGKNYF